HARFDSRDEKAIRKARDAATRTGDDMRGAQRIALDTGDACLFHAWMIHRGRYRAGVPRRTLDLIYKWGSGAATPPLPTCFADLTLLDSLSEHARAFYERFIRAYQASW